MPGTPLSRYMDVRSRSQGMASVMRAKVCRAATVGFADLFAVPAQAWGAELSLTSVTEAVPAPAPSIAEAPTIRVTLPTVSIGATATAPSLAPAPAPSISTTTTTKVTTRTGSIPSGPTAPPTQLAGSSRASPGYGSGGRDLAPGLPSSRPGLNGPAGSPTVH